jgi:hypothetical protein
MENKDTNSILIETKPEESKNIKVEEPKMLNYLSNNWTDAWEDHHGDIS